MPAPSLPHLFLDRFAASPWRVAYEVRQGAGWRTEAVSAHWYFERAPGIKDGVDLWDNRGFLTIKDSNTQSAAPDITRSSTNW